MSKRFLGNTANGVKVYAINKDEHMEAHSYVTDEMLKEAIQKVNYESTFWMDTIDLGRVIGTDNCVVVSDKDNVKMLYRKGRAGKTPIVYDKAAEETSLLTIGICTDNEDGLVTVFTAFTGIKAPKEPWDPSLKSDEAKAESEAFWDSHALVYDESAIDSERN